MEKNNDWHYWLNNLLHLLPKQKQSKLFYRGSIASFIVFSSPACWRSLARGLLNHRCFSAGPGAETYYCRNIFFCNLPDRLQMICTCIVFALTWRFLENQHGTFCGLMITFSFYFHRSRYHACKFLWTNHAFATSTERNCRLYKIQLRSMFNLVRKIAEWDDMCGLVFIGLKCL